MNEINMLRHFNITYSLLLLLLWSGIAEAATTPAVLVTISGYSYEANYHDANDHSQKAKVPISEEEYDSLQGQGHRPPTTHPPPDGKTYEWETAVERPLWSSTGTTELDTGNIVDGTEEYVVQLDQITTCHLPKTLYSLSDLTLTPNPPGWTMIDGIITITDVQEARDGCAI